MCTFQRVTSWEVTWKYLIIRPEGEAVVASGKCPLGIGKVDIEYGVCIRALDR